MPKIKKRYRRVTENWCDGVIVPGGLPDVSPAYWNEENKACHVVDEEMDRQQMAMIDRAVKLCKPIIGFCRGLQLVSVYFGASLIQDIEYGDEHCRGMKWLIQLLVVVCCFIGGTIGVDAALPWVDVVNMIMIVLNVGGTLFLLKMLREITLNYFQEGKDKLI